MSPTITILVRFFISFLISRFAHFFLFPQASALIITASAYIQEEVYPSLLKNIVSISFPTDGCVHVLLGGVDPLSIDCFSSDFVSSSH